MSVILVLAVTVAASAASVFFFRLAGWSANEARYWFTVADKVKQDRALDLCFKPVLLWTKAHRPSALRRAALPWSPPHRRMDDAATSGSDGRTLARLAGFHMGESTVPLDELLDRVEGRQT